MNVESLFFELLQDALWNVPAELDRAPTPEEWQALYSMARKHTVHGLLYDAVKSLPPVCGMPRELAAEWMLAAAAIERVYDAHIALIDRMKGFFAANGVTAVLIKGTETSSFYRNPKRRVLGDIDWWMPGDANWECAARLVESKGYSISVDSDGDCHYQVGGIMVEHHRKGLLAEGPVGILIMLNKHVLHHAAVTGIGMRHLCDMAAAYSALCGKYDAAGYALKLEELRMLRWTALLNAVLVHSLALPAAKLPDCCRTYRIPDRDVHRLERLIMSDGNFGLNKRLRYSGLVSRAVLLLKYAPWQFLRRWLRLIYGRTSR